MFITFDNLDQNPATHIRVLWFFDYLKSIVFNKDYSMHVSYTNWVIILPDFGKLGSYFVPGYQQLHFFKCWVGASLGLERKCELRHWTTWQRETLQVISNASHVMFSSFYRKNLSTSSPKGNNRSPESNVPRSNLISKNT